MVISNPSARKAGWGSRREASEYITERYDEVLQNMLLTPWPPPPISTNFAPRFTPYEVTE